MVQMHSLLLSWCYLSIKINQAQVLQHLLGYWLVKKLVQRPLSGACIHKVAISLVWSLDLQKLVYQTNGKFWQTKQRVTEWLNEWISVYRLVLTPSNVSVMLLEEMMTESETLIADGDTNFCFT